MTVIAIGNAISAQNFGTVGPEKIDKDFIEALQFVYPEFAFSPDAEAFSRRIFKLYSLNRSYADEAREMGLEKDPETEAFLRKIKRIIEDAYLAGLYQNLMHQHVTVTDEEAAEYYDKHTELFTVPGVYSFLQARIFQPTHENIASVKEKLTMYAQMGESLDEFKMGAEGVYAITFERDRTVRSNDALYKRLHDAEPLEILGPFKSDDTAIMLVVIGKTPENVLPYEEVRERCRDDVHAEKTAELRRKSLEEAMKKYPVKLNPSYFEKNK